MLFVKAFPHIQLPYSFTNNITNNHQTHNQNHPSSGRDDINWRCLYWLCSGFLPKTNPNGVVKTVFFKHLLSFFRLEEKGKKY